MEYYDKEEEYLVFLDKLDKLDKDDNDNNNDDEVLILRFETYRGGMFMRLDRVCIPLTDGGRHQVFRRA